MRKLKLPGRDVTRPRLAEQDVELIQEVGISGIKEQARDIVEEKLRQKPEKDGRKVPAAGNPVYKAMHACNAASRESLSMSHRIPEDKILNENDIDAVVNLLVRWIVREYNFYVQEENQKQKSLSDFQGPARY
ncbi:MAG: DUF4186 family protein [Candidatus Nanohaloarchaea archaeon]